MEYTKNYHLPQWKEDDRIMMRDFNQMCADMEKGLTENRTATSEGVKQLWEGLVTGAEGSLLLLRDRMDKGEAQDLPHCYYNRLDTAEDAEKLTEARWSQEKHIYMGVTTKATLEDLKAKSGVSQMGYVKDTPQDYAAFYHFTAPGKIRFTSWSFMLMAFLGETTGQQIDLNFQFKAERKTGAKWTQVFQSAVIPVHAEGTETTTIWTKVPVDFVVEEGETYRVALRQTTGSSVMSCFAFTTSASDSAGLYKNDIQVEMTPIAITSGSHVREIATAGRHRAVLLARYNIQPTAGGVTAKLNDVAMACSCRDSRDRSGKVCRELRAVAVGPFPEKADLRLDLTCGGEDDFQLLDYIICLL